MQQCELTVMLAEKLDSKCSGEEVETDLQKKKNRQVDDTMLVYSIFLMLCIHLGFATNRQNCSCKSRSRAQRVVPSAHGKSHCGMCDVTGLWNEVGSDLPVTMTLIVYSVK